MYEGWLDYDGRQEFLRVNIKDPHLWTIWKEIMSMLGGIHATNGTGRMAWMGLRYLMRLHEGDIPVSVYPADWSQYATPLSPPDPAEVAKTHEVHARLDSN